MNFRIIAYDFYANIKAWVRSKGTVFWTVAFPVLLILIFGMIFSGTNEASYNIYVQDLDDSEWSSSYISVLENISILNISIANDDDNISEIMEENDLSAAIVINEGFGETITMSFMGSNDTFNITFHYDPSEETTVSIIRSIIVSSLQEFNLQITGGKHIIGVEQISSLKEDFDFIDFFVPGMIGFTIMTSCIYGSIERNTKFRKDGILRKLLTTPITRAEWILSKMLFMVFLSFVSTSVIMVVGVLVWGISVKINAFLFILVVATSFLFSGLGMIIGRFVKEEETADMAGGAITFPMMFLAGTFFPLDQMPVFLQEFARILPLYYVNEAFRNSMIYDNFEKAIFFTFVVLIFAAVFFIVGVFLTKWKED